MLFQFGQIILVQTCHVVLYVADQHVDQCPRADGHSAGCAEPRDRFVAHVLYGENISAAQEFKLADQIIECRVVKPSFADIILLLKAWQRSLVIA